MASWETDTPTSSHITTASLSKRLCLRRNLETLRIKVPKKEIASSTKSSKLLILCGNVAVGCQATRNLQSAGLCPHRIISRWLLYE